MPCTMDSSSQNEDIKCISKLYVKNKPLYVQVVWKEKSSDLFYIKLFFEDDSWSGTYSKDTAALRRERLDETEEDYYANVKDCFNGNTKDYVHGFDISSDDIDSAFFTWKKRYEGALITHGVVSLQRDQVATPKETLIDSLLIENKKLISDIEVANKTNNGLKQNLEEYSQKIKEVIASKTSMESTLYAKFVQVLNEKKKRIQLLKEHLKKYEQ